MKKKSYYMNFKNNGKLIINAVYIRVLFEFGIVLILGILVRENAQGTLSPGENIPGFLQEKTYPRIIMTNSLNKYSEVQQNKS